MKRSKQAIGVVIFMGMCGVFSVEAMKLNDKELLLGGVGEPPSHLYRDPYALEECVLPPKFSWLYDGAKIGCVPYVDQQLLEDFAGQDQLNIGAVFSFDPLINHDIFQKQVYNLALQLGDIVCIVDRSKGETDKAIKLQEELNNYKKLTKNILNVMSFCNQKSIVYSSLSVLKPMNLAGSDLELLVEHIKKFIRAAEEIIKTGKSVVLVDNFEQNRVTVLGACWLIAQGWGIDQVIAQVCTGCNVKELDDSFLFLIQAFAGDRARAR